MINVAQKTLDSTVAPKRETVAAHTDSADRGNPNPEFERRMNLSDDERASEHDAWLRGVRRPTNAFDWRSEQPKRSVVFDRMAVKSDGPLEILNLAQTVVDTAAISGFRLVTLTIVTDSDDRSDEEELDVVTHNVGPTMVKVLLKPSEIKS